MTTLRSENGWLAPGGAFYPCALTEHGRTIKELVASTEDEAIDTGWLRLSSGEWSVPDAGRPVTFVQYGVLKDWHAAHARIMPDWIHKA